MKIAEAMVPKRPESKKMVPICKKQRPMTKRRVAKGYEVGGRRLILLTSTRNTPRATNLEKVSELLGRKTRSQFRKL